MPPANDRQHNPTCPGLARVGALLVCTLHSLGVAFSKLGVQDICKSNSIKPYSDNLPLEWKPDDWLAAGGVFGCALSLPLVTWCGRRSSSQLVALPLLLTSYIALYFLPKVELDRDKYTDTVWVFVFTVCLFLEGLAEMLSRVCIVTYSLETVCNAPGARDSCCPAVILTVAHLPYCLAHLLFVLLNLPLVRISPVLLLMLAMFLYTPLPESPVWLMASSKEERARAALASLGFFRRSPDGLPPRDYPEPIFTGRRDDDGWLRPLLVSCGILLLSQFTGREGYRFYSDWSFRILDLRPIAELTSSSTSLGAVTLSIVICCLAKGPRAPTWLSTISTAFITACLLGTGWLLHRLEQGGSFPDWVPVVLYLVHEFCYWLGLGSHALVVACSVPPLRARLPVLSLGLLLHAAISHVNVRALPLLLDALHPFGVFWLFASLSAVGLLYLATVVGPEMNFAAERKPINELNMVCLQRRRSPT